MADDPEENVPRYHLENRYQDSGWEPLDREYDDPARAADEACRLSRDAIGYGMTRVVDLATGRVVVTFPAGGPLPGYPGMEPGPVGYGPMHDYAREPVPVARVARSAFGDGEDDATPAGPPGRQPASRRTLPDAGPADGEDDHYGPGPLAAPPGAVDDVGDPKRPGGLKGFLLWLADQL